MWPQDINQALAQLTKIVPYALIDSILSSFGTIVIKTTSGATWTWEKKGILRQVK
jgi:hypothetical protein